jgi:hypothetical protein
MDRIRRVAEHREAEIWQTLVYDRKAVSPEHYNRLSRAYPPELPKKSKIKPTRSRPAGKMHKRAK